MAEDYNKRIGNYIARREARGDDTFNTFDIAKITGNVKEEYFPKPVKKTAETAVTEGGDAKQEAKFEPFYEGEKEEGEVTIEEGESKIKGKP